MALQKKATSLIKKNTTFFLEFAKSQQFAGVLLIGCTLLSLSLSNSSFSTQWLQIINASVANTTIQWLVNDVLMSFFFLLVGLEIRRELLVGELSNRKTAMLPIAGALGGMIVPAIIYFAFNYKLKTSSGWAIPTATDIAFAVGILNILGNRVPLALKIFITALAVVDDLGAVTIITIFYSNGINFIYVILLCATMPFFNFVLKKNHNNFYFIYIIAGAIMFFLLHHAHLHTTLSGVLLAAITPYSKKSEQSYLNKIEHILNKPVNYFIIPAFAIVNTAIVIDHNIVKQFNLSIFSGIFFGLVIGKPIGITLFGYLACKFKLANLPANTSFSNLLYTSILGGIGFTMSIFISLLAFSNNILVEQAKLAVLIASCLAGIVGFWAIKIASQKNNNQTI